MIHLAADPPAPSITTLAPIHDTRAPVSTAVPNLWERIAIACRVKHYSLSTERTYVAWARKFVAWSGRRHPRNMARSRTGLNGFAIEQARGAPGAFMGIELRAARCNGADRASVSNFFPVVMTWDATRWSGVCRRNDRPQRARHSPPRASARARCLARQSASSARAWA